MIYNGNLLAAGKKTGKDKKKVRLHFINLIGDDDSLLNIVNNLILKILIKFKKIWLKSKKKINETLNYILE